MRKLILIIFVFVLQGCVANPTTKLQSENLVGTWLLEDFGSEEYSHSILAFLDDGTKCVVTYDFLTDGTVAFSYYFNQYKLENSELVTTVGKSNSKYLPAGYEIRDKIKKLTATEFALVMVKPESDHPRVERHIRLKNENPTRVCDVVKEKLNL